MPKEPNVKCIITILVVFYFSNFSFSQENKIEGIYCASYKLKNFSTCYDFKENIFEYKHSGHTSLIRYGKGEYEIQNDTVILNYNLTEIKDNSYHSSKKYYNNKNYIEIRLRFFNLKNKPLKNITAWSKNNKEYKSVNNEGLIIFNFRKEQNSKDFIEINITGDNDNYFYRFHVNKKENQEINVYLSNQLSFFDSPKAVKHQILKYKIIKEGKKIIQLKGKGQPTLYLKN